MQNRVVLLGPITNCRALTRSGASQRRWAFPAGDRQGHLCHGRRAAADGSGSGQKALSGRQLTFVQWSPAEQRAAQQQLVVALSFGACSSSDGGWSVNKCWSVSLFTLQRVRTCCICQVHCGRANQELIQSPSAWHCRRRLPRRWRTGCTAAVGGCAQANMQGEVPFEGRQARQVRREQLALSLWQPPGLACRRTHRHLRDEQCREGTSF